MRRHRRHLAFFFFSSFYLLKNLVGVAIPQPRRGGIYTTLTSKFWVVRSRKVFVKKKKKRIRTL